MRIRYLPGPHFSYKISLKSREISPFRHKVLSIENYGFPIHISLFFTVKKFATLAWKGIPESRFPFAKWEVWIKHEPWNKCYEKCAPGFRTLYWLELFNGNMFHQSYAIAYTSIKLHHPEHRPTRGHLAILYPLWGSNNFWYSINLYCKYEILPE